MLGAPTTALPRYVAGGFRDCSMIETHQFFILEAWEPMDRFPRGGSVVEVEDEVGRVRLAAWRDDRIIVDGVDHPVTLKHWRPCPAP
jgi:hypothetical protein